MFLFERFKQYYLTHIFPQFSFATSLYKPVLGTMYAVLMLEKFKELYSSGSKNTPVLKGAGTIKLVGAVSKDLHLDCLLTKSPTC